MKRMSARLGLVCFGLLLALYPFTIEGSKSPARSQGGGADVQGTEVPAASSAVINFRELARQALTPQPLEPVPQAAPEPGEFDEMDTGKGPIPPDAPVNIPSPSVPSPAPANNFAGIDDIAAAPPGPAFFFIPPDTMGAVGTDLVNKVFVTLNNNYRVQDKTTGAAVGGDISMRNFWAPAGANNPFDPRIQYDPYNNRWVLAAVSDANSANTSILVGISMTSDPSGVYTLFRFSARIGGDSSSVNFADFPMLGFNKNWVVVSINMFSSLGRFFQGRVLVLDYPMLRTGVASATYFTGSSIGFCMHPVTTYSSTEPNEYLVQHLSSASATYDLSTLSGTPAAPMLTIGPLKTRPGGAWTQPGGNILPQAMGTCTSTPMKIDVGDAQVRSNAVYRNGTVWYPQTIGLPAGGPVTHTAVQWTQLDTTAGNFGNVLQGGRIEDPTATSTNGGKWYAYSSITVDAANDALLAFSQFSSSQFASAGYAYHDHTDAAGTMRDEVIYKPGEDCYSKDFGAGRNRWGDYSHTMVDPTNDFTLWTIQEYAKLQAPPAVGGSTSKWGTWWAELVCSLSSCPSDQNVVASASCPTTSSGAVSFSTPTTSGPCGDVTCSPASGTVFPVGSTTVTCNTPAGPSCTFKLNVFSFCLQDETTPGNFVLINANTGDYSFFCNGVQIASGTGVLNVKECIGSIQHNKGDRRIQINWDTSAEGVGAGTAIVQLGPNNTRCQITDKNMSNNTCTAPPVVTSPRGKPNKGQSQN